MIAIAEMAKKTVSHPNSSEPGRNTSDYYNKLFCRNLRKRREQLGLSLTDLGDMLGVERSRISQIEAGTYSVTIVTLSRLCTALHVHPSLLFSLDSDGSEFNDGVQTHRWPKQK